MPTTFESFLQGLPDVTLEEMPVNHIAHLDYLNDFLTNQAIKNDYLGIECEVFKRHLLYIFYGKPAFRLLNKSAFPICFVLKMPESDPAMAYPFDTGAFFHNRMDAYFKKTDHRLEDFQVAPLKNQNHRKIVSTFFEDNRQYYESKATRHTSLDGLPACVEGYYKMIADPVTDLDQLDNRKSAVEFLYDIPLELTKDSVELIVLPDIEFNIDGTIIEYDKLKNNLEARFNCVVESYQTMTRKPVTDFYDTIHRVVEKYLKTIKIWP